MFPLGLAGVIDRHLANDVGWGVMIGCYLIYLVHGFFVFPFKDHGANCGSFTAFSWLCS